VKNYPSEEYSGEESSASGGFFSSEKSSGEEFFGEECSANRLYQVKSIKELLENWF
jgi:hypothetical protein